MPNALIFETPICLVYIQQLFSHTVYFNLLFILFPSRGPYGFHFNSGAAKYTTTVILLYRTQDLAHLTWLFTRFLTAEKTVIDVVRLQSRLCYRLSQYCPS